MARQYHSLLIREDGEWAVQFGAWDRTDIDSERENYRFHGTRAADLKIIRTDGRQRSIDAAVAALNQRAVAEAG